MAPLLIPWEEGVHFKEVCYFLSLLWFSPCPFACVLESNSFTSHYCKVFYIPSVPHCPSLSKRDPGKCCHLHVYFYSLSPVTKDLKYYTAVRPDRCYISLLLYAEVFFFKHGSGVIRSYLENQRDAIRDDRKLNTVPACDYSVFT